MNAPININNIPKKRVAGTEKANRFLNSRSTLQTAPLSPIAVLSAKSFCEGSVPGPAFATNHRFQQRRMIVNYTQDGWQVITQRAHGIVAAQLAMQWRVKDRPQRWTETVLAIAEHDDAEVELDGENLLTPAGGPLNFDMKTFEAEHCQRLAMLSQTKSRYIALLTSLHMDFLYRKEEADNAEVRAFLKEQRALQEEWRKGLGLEKGDVTTTYDLLEWCDACSLLVCRGALQPERRSLEVSTGPDKKMYHLAQADETTLTVEPWPFEATAFDVSYEWRLIKQIQFSSSAEFREAFLAAPVEEQRWRLQKQKASPKTRKVK